MAFFRNSVLLINDFVALYASLIFALILRYGTDWLFRFRNHIVPFSFVFAIWILIFYIADLYRSKTFRKQKGVFTRLGLSVSIALFVSIIFFYAFGGFFRLTPKTNLLVFGLIFFVLDYVSRNVLIRFFAAATSNVLLLGESPLAEDVMAYLNMNPQAGYKISSWLKRIDHHLIAEAKETLKRERINFVIITPQIYSDKESVNQLIREFLPLNIGIVNFWDFYETIFEKAPLEELKEGWFVENITTRRPYYDCLKRLADFILSLLLTVIFLPVSFVIALAIKTFSPGPVIYRQKRTGRNGSVFELYKFRTMVTRNNGPLWTEEEDNRVTGIGRLLRFTHLDEIPQLINILKGDISFVGPRPERVELAEKYKDLPHYHIRHVVKPGLTGWAQINFKPSASLEEAYEKLGYDIYYVKNRSFFLDLRIILKTVKYVLVSHK